MERVSLVNMRVKLCPVDPQYQQILTYACILDRPYNPREPVPFRILYAHGVSKAIEKLDKHFPPHKFDSELRKSKKRDRRERDWTIYWPKPHWPPLGNPLTLPEECERWSSCHIASKVREQPHKIKKFEESLNERGQERKFLGPHFAMHICIENQPGTIYALLLELNRDSKQLEEPLEFDFNVEYVRSTVCRVRRYVKVDLYGDYLNTPTESESSSARLRNVQALVFHYLSSSDREKIIKIFQDSDYLIKTSCDKDPYVIIQKQGSAEVCSDKEEKRGYTMCPIARTGVCPIRKTQRSRNESSNSVGKYKLKIEVCLSDQPGALMELARLIATPR